MAYHWKLDVLIKVVCQGLKASKNRYHCLNILIYSSDKNFQWANTGATVFGTQSTSKVGEDEDGSDEEIVHNEDIHFEPIVSLPEVSIKK